MDRTGTPAGAPPTAGPVAGGPPALSVVLVVGPRRRRAGLALASVLDQVLAGGLEVLVLDLSGGPLPEAAHPAVRHLPMAPGTTFGQARSEGVRRARAGVVAFLEEHARAEPGWADALVRAHRGPFAAVGPAVGAANPGRGRTDAIGLMSYGRFRRPPAGGPVTLLPGQNSSFKRSVLSAYEADLPWMLMNDNLLFGRLARDGHPMIFAPEARVRHYDEGTLATAAASFFHYHRLYGHRRARVFGWSRSRRLAYTVLAPAIPLYYLLKLDRFLARAGETADRSLLWRQAPFVYACQLVGALGQAAGLLIGPGGSALAFTRWEVDGDRPGSEEP